MLRSCDTVEEQGRISRRTGDTFMSQTYYSLKDYLRSRFACDVRKLALHAHPGCPHRRTPEDGCVFCNESGFSDAGPHEKPVRDQIAEALAAAHRRGFRGKFIAYFQTGTNTLGEPVSLESRWRAVLEFPDDIVGLSIATRPDCLDDMHLGILDEIARSRMVWVELGLQSAKDETLRLINRGHDFAAFENAVLRIGRHPGIRSVAHIILGLPGETVEDMRNTVGALNRLNVDGVKIHHLQVVAGTVLANWYRHGRVRVFTEEEYADLLVTLIPLIDRKTVIHRLVGDIRTGLLIAPKWNRPKTRILQEVETRLRNAGLRQGLHAGR